MNYLSISWFNHKNTFFNLFNTLLMENAPQSRSNLVKWHNFKYCWELLSDLWKSRSIWYKIKIKDQDHQQWSRSCKRSRSMEQSWSFEGKDQWSYTSLLKFKDRTCSITDIVDRGGQKYKLSVDVVYESPHSYNAKGKTWMYGWPFPP